MSDLFVACIPGLEPLLHEELREVLGPDVVLETAPGGVECPDALPRLPEILLHSAIASRVLMRLGSFRARGFPDLERQAARLDLSKVRSPGRPLAFEVTSRKSRLYHTGAIEERLRRELDGGPDDAPDALRLVVRAVRDVFTLSADAGGDALHRRGYRLRTAKAPMRETLAAALLRASGWTPDRPLVDPFCGSGTIPIEAARRARGIAPGIDLAFDAEGWPGRDDAAWTAARAEAAARERAADGLVVLGSDRDAGAIEAAGENAARARVDDVVRFERAAVSTAPMPEGAIVVTNPPYGRRIGGGDLRDLFAALGRRMREAGAAGATLITDDAAPLRAGGLASRTLLRTRTGGIDVQFERVD